jgi:hypothetical protein
VDNTAALETLKTQLKAGQVPPRDLDFVSSLVSQAGGRGLSDKQGFWVVKIAQRLVAPEAASKKIADFSGVYALFAKAKEHLKFPKIHLRTASELVKLYISGPRSRVPDVVNVVGEESETWLGRVYPDGRWETGHGTHAAHDEVEGLLTRLASDPERVASEYGRLTGNCCFCSRKLSDERSTEVGYGPVCAKKFGLNWGSK